jgi:hypothetical protein
MNTEVQLEVGGQRRSIPGETKSKIEIGEARHRVGAAHGRPETHAFIAVESFIEKSSVADTGEPLQQGFLDLRHSPTSTNDLKDVSDST